VLVAHHHADEAEAEQMHNWADDHRELVEVVAPSGL
jgi:hypothetical protein